MVWVARSFTCMALVSGRSGQHALASVAKIPCKSPPKVGNARKWNAPDTKAGGGALRAYDLEPRMRGAPPWYSAACASYVSPQRAHARSDCFSLGTCSRVPSASATFPSNWPNAEGLCDHLQPPRCAVRRGSIRGPVGVRFGRRGRRVTLRFLVWGDFCQGGAPRVLSIFLSLSFFVRPGRARFFIPTHD